MAVTEPIPDDLRALLVAKQDIAKRRVEAARRHMWHLVDELEIKAARVQRAIESHEWVARGEQG